MIVWKWRNADYLFVNLIRVHPKACLELLDLRECIVAIETGRPELSPVSFCVGVKFFKLLWWACVDGPKPVGIFTVGFELKRRKVWAKFQRRRNSPVLPSLPRLLWNNSDRTRSSQAFSGLSRLAWFSSRQSDRVFHLYPQSFCRELKMFKKVSSSLWRTQPNSLPAGFAAYHRMHVTVSGCRLLLRKIFNLRKLMLTAWSFSTTQCCSSTFNSSLDEHRRILKTEFPLKTAKDRQTSLRAEGNPSKRRINSI